MSIALRRLLERVELRSPPEGDGPGGTAEPGPEPGASPEPAPEPAASAEPDSSALSLPPSPATPPAPEPESAAAKRISALTAEKWAERRAREAAETQARVLQQQLADALEQRPVAEPEPGAATDEPRYTRAQVEEHARRLAQGYGNAAAQNAEFTRQVNTEVVKGRAEYADFDTIVAQLQSLTGPDLPREIVDAALETGAAADVLYALGKDLSEADRILSLPPQRQAVAIARLADKVSATKAAKPTPGASAAASVSAAPAPIAPKVGGVASVAIDLADETVPIGDWIAARTKQLNGRATR